MNNALCALQKSTTDCGGLFDISMITAQCRISVSSAATPCTLSHFSTSSQISQSYFFCSFLMSCLPKKSKSTRIHPMNLCIGFALDVFAPVPRHSGASLSNASFEPFKPFSVMVEYLILLRYPSYAPLTHALCANSDFPEPRLPSSKIINGSNSPRKYSGVSWNSVTLSIIIG